VIFSASEVLPLARLTGYKADMIEKVLHLLLLLNALNTHPCAKGKLGTGLLTSFWADRDMRQDKKKVQGQMQQVVFLVGRP
jgi:hypothetical protein